MGAYMLGSALFTAAFGASLIELTLGPPREPVADDSQIVLIRHATADRDADMSGVQSGDATTHRELSRKDRLEAEQMGEKLQRHGLSFARVLVSPFCQARETAELMRLEPIEISPAFQDVRNDRRDAACATRLHTARIILNSWRGPGALAIVTHNSTIKALTGLEPDDGKFIVYANRLRAKQNSSAKPSQVSF